MTARGEVRAYASRQVTSIELNGSFLMTRTSPSRTSLRRASCRWLPIWGGAVAVTPESRVRACLVERFLGMLPGPTTEAVVLVEADTITGWLDAGLDAYVYFDNDSKVRAPLDAAGLIEKMRG